MRLFLGGEERRGGRLFGLVGCVGGRQVGKGVFFLFFIIIFILLHTAIIDSICGLPVPFDSVIGDAEHNPREAEALRRGIRDVPIVSPREGGNLRVGLGDHSVQRTKDISIIRIRVHIAEGIGIGR